MLAHNSPMASSHSIFNAFLLVAANWGSVKVDRRILLKAHIQGLWVRTYIADSVEDLVALQNRAGYIHKHAWPPWAAAH